MTFSNESELISWLRRAVAEDVLLFDCSSGKERIEDVLGLVELSRESRLTRKGTSILNTIHPRLLTFPARCEEISILPFIFMTQN